jgi:uncharacterized protein
VGAKKEFLLGYFKLVVTGPFNAGKTALIQAVNEIRGVNTDVRTETESHVKPQTTVAMDFGKVTLPGGTSLHLVGTPGQRRLGFMWEVLMLECHGILFLVDSSAPATFDEAGEMLDFFSSRANGVPIFVAANKQDRPGALPPEEVGRHLRLVGPGQQGRVTALPPLGCVADDRASVMMTLEKIAPYLSFTRE